MKDCRLCIYRMITHRYADNASRDICSIDNHEILDPIADANSDCFVPKMTKEEKDELDSL